MTVQPARGRVDQQGPGRTPRVPAHGGSARSATARAGQVTVAFRGALDLASAPALRDRLALALAQHPARLVLDLSRCDFADCSAVNLVLDVRRAAGRQDTALVLSRPSPPVRRLFDLLRQAGPPAAARPRGASTSQRGPR